MFSIAAPPKDKGQVMGYFVTVISLSTLIMPLVVGNMIQKGDKTFASVANVLTINCFIGNVLGGICFFIAGFGYAKEIEEQNEHKAQSMAEALVKVPELARSHETLKLNKNVLNEASKRVVGGISVRETMELGRNSAVANLML